MTTLKDLIAHREGLDKQIADMRQQQRSEVISQEIKLISEYELTQQDPFDGASGSKRLKLPLRLLPITVIPYLSKNGLVVGYA